jgi:hypothetical protein
MPAIFNKTMNKKHKDIKPSALDVTFEKLLFIMQQREILNHIPVKTKIINGRLTFLTTFLELCN